jgi:hypothetical protein
LSTIFRPPNEKYNTILNCSSQLWPNKWNICTNTVQIARILLAFAQNTIKDGFDDKGSGSLHQQLVDLIIQEKLDISETHPESQFSHLPSFGINRAVTILSGQQISKGTGYSTVSPLSTWGRHPAITQINIKLNKIRETIQRELEREAWQHTTA